MKRALLPLLLLAACGGSDAAMMADLDGGAPDTLAAAGSSGAAGSAERVDTGAAGASVTAGSGGGEAGAPGGSAGSVAGATAGTAGAPLAGAGGAPAAGQGGSAVAGAGGGAAGAGGSGTTEPTCALTITGAPLVFDDLKAAPNATSETRSVTITNASSEPMVIGVAGFASRYAPVMCVPNPNHAPDNSPYPGESGFASSISCASGDPIPPGASCVLSFRFVMGSGGGKLGTVAPEQCEPWQISARGERCGVIHAAMTSPRIVIVPGP